MNLDDLDRALTRWADKYYLSPYTLRKDTKLMILILQEMPKGFIEDHLKEEYQEHFSELEEEE